MWLRVLRLGAACAAMVLALSACGQREARHDRVVTISERDFAISAPKVVHAGTVRLRVVNKGPVSHELLLVHAPLGQLPMRADGLTLDEEALQSSLVGVLEPAGPGSRRTLEVHLTVGRYVLFCNMAGHYMSGMSTSVRVI